ncbi:MAG: BamA/TamA family outer membrane protein [Rhodobacter sp.]|nr:BamA/TamA family outer membrane protein [Rhodobacter sp.]
MAFRSQKGRRLAAAACLAGLLAGPVSAADEIRFLTPGASAELQAALRAASTLLAAEREDRSDAQDLFAAARAEYSALLAALYARAFYSPVITVSVDGREAASIAPLDAPGTIRQIIVTVQPGPDFAFSQTRIAPLAKGTTLPDGFAAGLPAATGVIRDAAKAAVEGWRNVGHAKAAVGSQDLVVDHKARTLAASLEMQPGPKLRFGTFNIQGQKRMREDRIRAIAGFPEGKVFDPAALRRSAERLRRTGVFRSVSLAEAENPGPDGTLDIGTTLVEDLPRRFGAGGEISTLDGLDVTAFWMHRNLLGGAERLRFDLAVENIGSSGNRTDYILGATVERPATFTPDTLLGIGATAQRLDEEDQTIDLATLGITATQFVSDRLTLRGGLQVRGQRVTDLTADYTFYNLALPLGATYDGRNDKFSATNGYFIAAELTPFLGWNGTGSGGRLTLDGRAYRGFGAERPVVLAGRVQVGSVFGPGLEDTPRDYLFYSGGAGTVRGHPFQSLGVYVISPDQLTGGTRFVALSGEIRAPVTERIGVVGFYDVGSVGVTDFFDDPQGGWQAGAGIGIRYATGFGPIRVDIATPIQGSAGQNADGSVQLYVGIGQSF